MGDTTSVQIIRRKNGMFLVQWFDGDYPKRAWVVEGMLSEISSDGSKALAENPSEGIPYGVDWAKFADDIALDAEAIDRGFKRRGIWTIDDLQSRPNEARATLIGLYSQGVSKILGRALEKVDK